MTRRAFVCTHVSSDQTSKEHSKTFFLLGLGMLKELFKRKAGRLEAYFAASQPTTKSFPLIPIGTLLFQVSVHIRRDILPSKRFNGRNIHKCFSINYHSVHSRKIRCHLLSILSTYDFESFTSSEIYFSDMDNLADLRNTTSKFFSDQ